MPPRPPALRSPPTKIAFAFIFFSFPSSSANQRARSLASSKFPKQAAFSFLPFLAPLRPPCAFPPAVGVKIPRSGLGAASPCRRRRRLLGVGPARFSGVRLPLRFGFWLRRTSDARSLALSLLGNIYLCCLRWVAKKGRERDGDGLSLLGYLARSDQRAPDIDSCLARSKVSRRVRRRRRQRSCANASKK